MVGVCDRSWEQQPQKPPPGWGGVCAAPKVSRALGADRLQDCVIVETQTHFSMRVVSLMLYVSLMLCALSVSGTPSPQPLAQPTTALIEDCPTGKYQSVSGECEECPTGSYSDLRGALECDVCLACLTTDNSSRTSRSGKFDFTSDVAIAASDRGLYFTLGPGLGNDKHFKEGICDRKTGECECFGLHSGDDCSSASAPHVNYILGAVCLVFTTCLIFVFVCFRGNIRAAKVTTKKLCIPATAFVGATSLAFENRGTELQQMLIASAQNRAAIARDANSISLRNVRDSIRKQKQMVQRFADATTNEGKANCLKLSSVARSRVQPSTQFKSVNSIPKAIFFPLTHVVLPLLSLARFPAYFFSFFFLQFLFNIIKLLTDVYIIIKSTMSIPKVDIIEMRMERVRDALNLFLKKIGEIRIGNIQIPVWNVTIPWLRSIATFIYDWLMVAGTFLGRFFTLSWIPSTITACEGARAPGELLTTTAVVIILTFLFDAKVFPFLRITMTGMAKGLKTYLDNCRFPSARPKSKLFDHRVKLRVSVTDPRNGIELVTVPKGQPQPARARDEDEELFERLEREAELPRLDEKAAKERERHMFANIFQDLDTDKKKKLSPLNITKVGSEGGFACGHGHGFGFLSSEVETPPNIFLSQPLRRLPRADVFAWPVLRHFERSVGKFLSKKPERS